MERLQILLYDTSCNARLLYYHAHSCVEAHEQLCPKFLQYREAMRMYNEVVGMIRMQRTLEEREETTEEGEERIEGERVATETESVETGSVEARMASEVGIRIRGQIAEAQSFISDLESPILQISAYLAAENVEL